MCKSCGCMDGWTDGWMEGSQKCHLILFIFKHVNKYAIDLLNISRYQKYQQLFIGYEKLVVHLGWGNTILEITLVSDFLNV